MTGTARQLVVDGEPGREIIDAVFVHFRQDWRAGKPYLAYLLQEKPINKDELCVGVGIIVMHEHV